MAKKRAALSDELKAYYDDLADRAAKKDGPCIILGSIDGSLKVNADCDVSNAMTLARIRYLLQAYNKALEATISHRGGDYHAEQRT